MCRITKTLIVLTALLVLCPTDALSQNRQRAEIPVAETWNLEDLYPSVQAWNKAKETLAAKFGEVLKYKGKLADSPNPHWIAPCSMKAC